MKLTVPFLGIVALALFTSAARGADLKSESPRDPWMSGTSRDEKGLPLIHSLRTTALELPNRARYRWRVGISWRFRHALDNGMPGPEDRTAMSAIDDAIQRDFERNDESRLVYFSTGGGIREVMIYATSEVAAWARIDALVKQFPAAFPGKREQWAYVKEDADWSGYRSLVAALRPPSR